MLFSEWQVARSRTSIKTMFCRQLFLRDFIFSLYHFIFEFRKISDGYCTTSTARSRHTSHPKKSKGNLSAISVDFFSKNGERSVEIVQYIENKLNPGSKKTRTTELIEIVRYLFCDEKAWNARRHKIACIPCEFNIPVPLTQYIQK